MGKVKSALINLAALLLLGKLMSRRNRRYLTNQDIPTPRESAWACLFRSRRDEAFICTMNVNVAGFMDILGRFEPLYETNARGNAKQREKGGRPRKLDSAGALGLVLHYLNTTMSMKSLHQIFGIGPSTTSRTLRRALKCLLLVLREHTHAQFRWPTERYMRHLSGLVRNRDPALTGIIGFADGLNLPIRVPSDPIKQGAYFNGWLHGCFVSQVVMFLADGTIGYVRYNCLSSGSSRPESSPDPSGKTSGNTRDLSES
jgi:hypothetical protein